jgi:hypothetical protein
MKIPSNITASLYKGACFCGNEDKLEQSLTSYLGLHRRRVFCGNYGKLEQRVHIEVRMEMMVS